MVLVLFYDGSKVEIPQCEDVVHKPGCLICVDYLGSPITSFLDVELAGYTLDPPIITALRSIPDHELQRD
jgi:hypothetical protein